MPWKEVKAMDLKIRFINDWKTGDANITDLSQIYDISRTTAYKWLRRYNDRGIIGLAEQSRAPKSCPHRTPANIIELVTEERRRNHKRGARKIRAKLMRKNPLLQLPAVSTISYWLKKEGLVAPRKKRHRVPSYARPFAECQAANDVWSIDYKGQFPLTNRQTCYPLTISDNFSRYILGCRALPGPRYVPTRSYLEAIFRKFGLPSAIRTDNGTPFAGCSIGGLSRLMIWFIKLGIVPERIEKGCPEQNGRHERMHRTLKADVAIGRSLSHQQSIFDRFCAEFNHERPHEALGDRIPSECYQRSQRPYVESPKLPDYPANCQVRLVRNHGEICFMGQRIFLTNLLAGEPVGLKQITDELWLLNYGVYSLGTIDMKRNKIIQKV